VDGHARRKSAAEVCNGSLHRKSATEVCNTIKRITLGTTSRNADMNAAKKAKTEPVFPGKIDGVDKPLLQTLATVCQKLYDDKLYAEFKPKDGESNDMLDQPYKLFKKGGEYTDEQGHVISGVSVFNNTTEKAASLAEFGEVKDGITDFHGEFQAAFPPFAALIVQPKDDPKAVRAPITQSHPPENALPPFSSPTQLREGGVRLCVAGPHPHPRLARVCHGV
jgi:hypothetical protein